MLNENALCSVAQLMSYLGPNISATEDALITAINLASDYIEITVGCPVDKNNIDLQCCCCVIAFIFLENPDYTIETVQIPIAMDSEVRKYKV